MCLISVRHDFIFFSGGGEGGGGGLFLVSVHKEVDIKPFFDPISFFYKTSLPHNSILYLFRRCVTPNS